MADPAETGEEEVPKVMVKQVFESSKIPWVNGLQNLGNSCFLNGGIQALAHVPVVRDFLVADALDTHVNTTSPLSHHGAIARALATVLRAVRDPDTPVDEELLRSFKRTVCSFAPQFEGVAQHDAHEFVALLLDALHDDLDRLPRPVATAESPADADDATRWAAYLASHKSHIVDCFHGALKSTVACQTCGNETTAFEAFSSLALPVPPQSTIRMVLPFVPLDAAAAAQRPLQVCVEVPRDGLVSDLQAALHATLAAREPHVERTVGSLWIVETHNHRIFANVPAVRPLKDIVQKDALLCVEVVEPPPSAVPTLPSTGGGAPGAPPGPPKLGGPPPPLMRKPPGKPGAAGAAGAAAAPPAPLEPYAKELVHVRVVLRRLVAPPAAAAAVDGEPAAVKSKRVAKEWNTSLIGVPFILSLKPATTSTRDIHTLLEKRLARGSKGAFTMRACNATGSSCARCPSASSCVGCAVPVDDARPLLAHWDEKTHTLAVDWTEDNCDAAEFEALTPDSSLELLKKDEAPAATLSDCVGMFCARELLSGDNAVLCTKCNAQREVIKQFGFARLPPVLFIQLKRFGSRDWRDKLETFVDIPEYLDLRPQLADAHGEARATVEQDVAGALSAASTPGRYRLCAVVNHSGASGVGHYTANVREGDKWFVLNDMAWRECEPAGVSTAFAYLLFYTVV